MQERDICIIANLTNVSFQIDKIVKVQIDLGFINKCMQYKSRKSILNLYKFSWCWALYEIRTDERS